jgi:DNA-directed RNA polymerase subunit RPC12/RpoP
MLTKIKCPKCNTEGTFSIADPVYEGPYKCWKCRELFKIRMEHNVLKFVEPMSGDELAKFEQVQTLKNKFKRPQ